MQQERWRQPREKLREQWHEHRCDVQQGKWVARRLHYGSEQSQRSQPSWVCVKSSSDFFIHPRQQANKDSSAFSIIAARFTSTNVSVSDFIFIFFKMLWFFFCFLFFCFCFVLVSLKLTEDHQWGWWLTPMETNAVSPPNWEGQNGNLGNESS